MNLSIGIVGLPNAGKSTLFNALTKKKVPAENFPFCTIDPSVGVVIVPDTRLEALSKLSHSKKTIPAAVQFVDIAGLVRGASNGEGLGNAFLSHIREVDAIAHVVRAYHHNDIIHVEGAPSPVRDIGIINAELALADIQIAQKRLDKLASDVRAGKKEAIVEKDILEKTVTILSSGDLLHDTDISTEERALYNGLGFLTHKPTLLVANISSNTNNDLLNELRKYATEKNIPCVVVDVANEQELSEIEEQKETLRKELGIEGDGVDTLITEAYRILKLQTYFTTGEDETRAWTYLAGSTAPQAGRAIHTDFEKKFIRAEVVACADLLASHGYSGARAQGKVRVEGKEYIVTDGDVIEFRV
ncbi:MAG: redox-regulated ATPase YchF [Alphaproteobacteria bacterium]|nr:redox-regulated ATPase YchF [Alphaproteobacteria bacterium]